MDEEAKFALDTAKEGMENAIDYLEKEYAHMRAGKADARILNNIKVDYYGTTTPLYQASNLSTPDAKTIMIQPWDKSMIPEIEKAIMAANIGFTPANNGEVIRINIPPLTEETRRELVKKVKKEAENAKISIRNHRRDTNDELKKLEKEGLSEDARKDYEQKVQKLHDEYIKKVEETAEVKEQEIMTI
ncbi:MAG: ribosome recycling factor [Bacteroidales bacterium]